MALSRTEELFTRIYADNAWGGSESRSGPGSGIARTQALRSELERLVRDLLVRSILDLPCGDFHWMNMVDFPATQYIGADIVAPLIAANNQRYARPGRQFVRLDLLRDPLPKADVILCRDALVHLSFSDIAQALHSMKHSGSAYFLVTTFLAHTRNRDIPAGAWRPLNLSLAPFCFPEPLRMLCDARPDGTYPDKVLALYRFADLPSHVCNLGSIRRFYAAIDRGTYRMQRFYHGARRRASGAVKS